jgi:hypothetical protein
MASNCLVRHSVRKARFSRNGVLSIPQVATRLGLSRDDAEGILRGEPGVLPGQQIPRDVFDRVHERLGEMALLMKTGRQPKGYWRRWWRRRQRSAMFGLRPKESQIERICTRRNSRTKPIKSKLLTTAEIAKKLKISQTLAAFILRGEPGILPGENSDPTVPIAVYRRIDRRLNALVVLMEDHPRFKPLTWLRWWRREQRAA